MQKRFAIQAIAAGLGLVLSSTAPAQTPAYTNAAVDLYAGPAPDYPIVAEIPAGTPLTVMGCVQDYSWCDVAAPDLRGWAYGGYLSYPYQGTDVPVIVFSIDSYWGRHYHDRPWYHDEARWAHRRPPERGVRPPERGEAGRPPGPQPRREAPAYGHAPEARPPERGSEQPRVQAQPGDRPPHAAGNPPMHTGPGAMPAPRGGFEARGDQNHGGGGGRGGGGGEREERQSNH